MAKTKRTVAYVTVGKVRVVRGCAVCKYGSIPMDAKMGWQHRCVKCMSGTKVGFELDPEYKKCDQGVSEYAEKESEKEGESSDSE